jgi:putative solute:sodium symporter small subunit
MATTAAAKTGPTGGRGGSGGDLTDRQRQDYWRYNVALTTVLLIIWFVVTFIISGLLAGWLNNYTILGFPLGYYMAAQGSLAIFVLEIAVYAYLMNKKDEEFGIREEG